MLMETASVQKDGLHLVPVLSIPMYFAAPVRHLRASISAVGLKRGSFGIARYFDEIHFYWDHWSYMPMSAAIKIRLG